MVDDTWTFNDNFACPTFTPSVLVTYLHPEGHDNDNPAPVGYNGKLVEGRCHSFVIDGKIQFLLDCTHALAGQIVDLPELPGWLRNE